jgi:NAD(P)-dependent dehydrogenase (short-subunit alcohol dehydrogenase family)
MNSMPKVPIVTGASHGIGAGLVPANHKLGYAVVMNSPRSASRAIRSC